MEKQGKIMKLKDKTPGDNISRCPICGSALKEYRYYNGMRIKCGGVNRCINLASQDCARVRDLLHNADWRMTAEEAKPCPRCGGDKIEIWFEDEKFWIYCTKTGCWASGETLAEALAQWKELCNKPRVDAVKEIARNVESMEDKRDEKPTAIIAPCPKCGKIPVIHDVSDTYDDEHMISCCDVSKSREGYYETIEAWNDYTVEYQLKSPAERS